MKELVWPPHFTEAEQEMACRRAVREAQMAGRLAHVNVVRIYDILQEDGNPWIIMELLPYQSLRDLVQADGPLAPVRAARVGLGVLAALRAAHAEGVLHRDVKPANILVGPDGRVVLTDFGIARAVDSPTLAAGWNVTAEVPDHLGGGIYRRVQDRIVIARERLPEPVGAVREAMRLVIPSHVVGPQRHAEVCGAGFA